MGPTTPHKNWSSIFALCRPTSMASREGVSCPSNSFQREHSKSWSPASHRASPFLPESCDFLEPGQPENRCQTQHSYLSCSHCLLLWELQRDCGHTERWQSSALNKGVPRDCCHISEESSFYPWRWGWSSSMKRWERGRGHGHPLLRPCKTVHRLLLWCNLWGAEVAPYLSMHHQSLAQFLVHRWCWMDAENQNRTGWLTAPG